MKCIGLEHCSWALRKSSDIFILCRESGTIEAVNNAFILKLGYDERDVIGKSLEHFFESQEKWCEFRDVSIKKQQVDNISVFLRKKEGPLIKGFAYTEYIQEKTEGEGYLRVIVKKVGEKQDLEARLPNIEKMAALGYLSASVAHEINNPLNIILGYAQLLLEDFEPGTEAYESLQEIEKCSKMCRQVVSDLLKFSRTHKKEKKVININECLEEVISVCSHQLMLSRIKLHKKFSEEPLLVLGDANKLKQVFLNLVVNAQQAIGEDGTISIISDSDPENNEIVICIKDSGCGIPPEVQKRIFEPFFTTKKGKGGTGLGLAVSRNIIVEHGGRVEIKSKVNEGTEFKICLPRVKEQ